ncbi:DUF6345 domain-containing protein [Lentzea sp. NPDC051838]|uniref:DUF6345 domain-containing protein n=1 Tax=Lentzea sp. NPDC051838 TaxID=3154849 RepID=UPI00342FE49E
MPNNLRIGVGWSTHFPRRGVLNQARCRRLRYAYRAPSFVTEEMVADGSELTFLKFDEGLAISELDGTNNALASNVDFFYVASHGTCATPPQYKLILHGGEWPITGADLGVNGPSVATFDTCDLVDLKHARWKAPWETAGAQLRLLLGFASAATVAENSTRRGLEFSQKIIAGDPIAQAWLQAVHHNSYQGTDLGIAIAFGDSDKDVDWVLYDMTLGDLPCPRSTGTPVIAAEVCH